MRRSITIPNTLGEITLEMYQRFLAIEEPTNEQMVGIFTSITPQEVLELPSGVYNQAIEVLTNTLSQIGDSQKLVMRFNIEGKEFGMIPNLDEDEISYGENKDLTKYLQDWSTMHLAMSVLFRPIENKISNTYSIEKYKGTREHRKTMGQMPLDIVLGAQLFFYNLTRDLLRAIPSYLERVIHKDKEAQALVQTIKENGEDMMKSIASLKGI